MFIDDILHTISVEPSRIKQFFLGDYLINPFRHINDIILWLKELDVSWIFKSEHRLWQQLGIVTEQNINLYFVYDHNCGMKISKIQLNI